MISYYDVEDVMYKTCPFMSKSCVATDCMFWLNNPQGNLDFEEYLLEDFIEKFNLEGLYRKYVILYYEIQGQGDFDEIPEKMEEMKEICSEINNNSEFMKEFVLKQGYGPTDLMLREDYLNYFNSEMMDYFFQYMCNTLNIGDHKIYNHIVESDGKYKFSIAGHKICTEGTCSIFNFVTSN